MSELILDEIDKIETPGEDYFTQTKTEYMPLDKVILEQKDRIAELEATNKEMLAELELHKEKCKYLEIYDSCKECTMNESCGLLRVINKARGEKDV